MSAAHIFCINCGCKLPRKAKFCQNCGAHVPRTSSGATPPPLPDYVEPSASKSSKKPKKNKRKRPLILFLIIGTALFLLRVPPLIRLAGLGMAATSLLILLVKFIFRIRFLRILIVLIILCSLTGVLYLNSDKIPRSWPNRVKDRSTSRIETGVHNDLQPLPPSSSIPLTPADALILASIINQSRYTIELDRRKSPEKYTITSAEISDGKLLLLCSPYTVSCKVNNRTCTGLWQKGNRSGKVSFEFSEDYMSAAGIWKAGIKKLRLQIKAAPDNPLFNALPEKSI